VTGLLLRWRRGDDTALERLLPLVYSELRQLARSCLRHERNDHTLQPTALVHEAFLRLFGGQGIDWKDRSHFFGIAARIMRQVLVAHARHRKALKRGSGLEPLELDESITGGLGKGIDLVELEDALGDLERIDPRQSRLVELRFYAGLTLEETAEVLACSPATVSREWALARTWLYHQLRGGDTEA
jgi:RNA polymerase sigma factor (TIGR02999 family)